MSDTFEVVLSVKEDECDATGVVNNAVYQQYLEHARHQYLTSLSIDLDELAKNNISLVVLKATLTYLSPLKRGDELMVSTTIQRRSPTKFQFNQEIHDKTDNKLIVKADIIGTALGKKGAILPNELGVLVPGLKVLDQK